MKKSTWNWYGVKLIKEIVIDGDPIEDLLDDDYDNTQKTFEEVVLLVHAQSFDHAYKLAEKISLKEEEPYTNCYGETVTWKYRDAIDCFWLFDEPKSGVEVYSRLFRVDKSVSFEEIANRFSGAD